MLSQLDLKELLNCLSLLGSLALVTCSFVLEGGAVTVFAGKSTSRSLELDDHPLLVLLTLSLPEPVLLLNRLPLMLLLGSNSSARNDIDALILAFLTCFELDALATLARYEKESSLGTFFSCNISCALNTRAE